MNCPSCGSGVGSGDFACPRCGVGLLSGESTLGSLAEAPPDRPFPEFPPGATFARRYTIIERAGAGGMGVVYKAIDRSLDTAVALKLMLPAIAARPAYVESFKREVRLARQIAHPNICRVHDIGEDGGVLYLSMEWVPGETLRQLMRHAGVLDPYRAVTIAERILLALEAAHEKGIVHRDLKPENVMIDDAGAVRVMDFGLAVQRMEGEIPIRTTAAGTPAYMAPEQRLGASSDGRADLYALGLCMLEMLTGGLPEPGGIASTSLSPSTRVQLWPFLEKLLAERPADRFASARKAYEALATIRATLTRPSESAPAMPPVRKLRRPHWIGLGGLAVAAIVVTAFVVRYALRPNPSSSAALAAGTASSPGDPFYERGLEYLREHSEHVRGVDDAIQMFHRSVEADPRFARGFAGLATAYAIRGKLTSETTAKELGRKALERARALAPSLPEAHCAEGIAQYAESDYAAAAASLQAAVALDSGLDMAWAHLGAARKRLGDYAGAQSALREAIKLKPGSPMYRIMLGNFYEGFGEYDAAAGAYNDAIALKPNSRWAWNDLGAAFLRIGRLEEATSAFQRSLEIEENASARSNLGTAFYYQRRYERAIENYKLASALEPGDPVHWGNTGDALRMLARNDEARTAYRHATDLARDRSSAKPLDPSLHEQLALYCAKGGDSACALEEGALAHRLSSRDSAIVFTNAIIRALIGRREEALDWLERAVNLGLTRTEIENEPDLAPLHDSPRYREILAMAS